MNYYTQINRRSKAGVKYTQTVKADTSPPLQKSAKGAYFRTTTLPNGQSVAVIIHKKGDLQPIRNPNRLPKVLRRARAV